MQTQLCLAAMPKLFFPTYSCNPSEFLLLATVQLEGEIHTSTISTTTILLCVQR